MGRRYHKAPFWVRAFFIFVVVIGFVSVCLTKAICDGITIWYVILFVGYLNTCTGTTGDRSK